MFQKHILDLLRATDEQHYARLQPEGVESSHFKYHLNQLIKDGYVVQKRRGVYALSTKGLAFVDTLSEASVIPESNPKVITYSLLQNQTHYYFQRKQKQPYRGLVNMVGGKIHLGETSAQAATREVKEKAGVEGLMPVQIGVAEIMTQDGSSLISHVVAYVYQFTVADDYSNAQLIRVAKSEFEHVESPAPDLFALVSASQKPGFSLEITAEL